MATRTIIAMLMPNFDLKGLNPENGDFKHNQIKTDVLSMQFLVGVCKILILFPLTHQATMSD